MTHRPPELFACKTRREVDKALTVGVDCWSYDCTIFYACTGLERFPLAKPDALLDAFLALYKYETAMGFSGIKALLHVRKVAMNDTLDCWFDMILRCLKPNAKERSFPDEDVFTSFN